MIFINFHLLKDVLQQCYKDTTPILVTYLFSPSRRTLQGLSFHKESGNKVLHIQVKLT